MTTITISNKATTIPVYNQQYSFNSYGWCVEGTGSFSKESLDRELASFKECGLYEEIEICKLENTTSGLLTFKLTKEGVQYFKEDGFKGYKSRIVE